MKIISRPSVAFRDLTWSCMAFLWHCMAFNDRSVVLCGFLWSFLAVIDPNSFGLVLFNQVDSFDFTLQVLFPRYEISVCGLVSRILEVRLSFLRPESFHQFQNHQDADLISFLNFQIPAKNSKEQISIFCSIQIRGWSMVVQCHFIF